MSYKPFFKETRKLLKEQYEDFNDVPEDVVEFFTSNVKEYDHYYSFYDDGDSLNLEDTKEELRSGLAQRVMDSGFQPTTLDLEDNEHFDYEDSWAVIPIDYSSLGRVAIYKRTNAMNESTNWRDYPEEEGEESANEADLYPHRYGMLKEWVVVFTIDQSMYMNSYEERDDAGEALNNIVSGSKTLSITFKDGSVVIMDAEGSDESFTVEGVRLAKVDDEDQGFLFDDPEHQISEKTGVASQFNEICQGFSDSYDVYQFAINICNL